MIQPCLISIRKPHGWRKGKRFGICVIRHLSASCKMPALLKGRNSLSCSGFPNWLIWLVSRLQAEECSLEPSGPPSVIPRTLLPSRDLPDSPWLWGEPQVTGMKMQPKHQQPERDIKPSQNISCMSALPPCLLLSVHEKRQTLPLHYN